MSSETQLNLALTVAEKAAIRHAATAQGLTVSQYLKSLLVANVPSYPPQVERRGGDRRKSK